MATATPAGRRGKEWHELPLPLQIKGLKDLRERMRRENLHSTGSAETRTPRRTPNRPRHRTYDGSAYDPDDADMGRAGTRFDRNAPLEMTQPEPPELLLTPSPRAVAQRLLTRHEFRPATRLNMLAAAWIQFQIHDWFSHGDNEVGNPIEVPLNSGDSWHECPMRVRRTRLDSSAEGTAGRTATFENTVSHWWDGSQLYASSEEACRRLRTGEDGKLRIEGGRLPADESRPGFDLTGVNDNYWLGLALMHTLFAKEHNAICDMLRRAYPSWDDERLFHTARLVNVAVMAKIHTVEWTPGILDTPVLRIAMNTNWHGLLGSDFRRKHGRLGRGEVLSGILGSGMDHHAARYSTTAEFVTCYRLHPLLRDDYPLASHRDGAAMDTLGLTEIQGKHTRNVVEDYGMADLLYSFGRLNPGAVALHNHPNPLRDHLRVSSGERVDLGTVDVLRDRERGIPRYNGFRQMVHKPPVTDFEQLADNPRDAAALREVYEGDIDRVDAMVGMYAERLPPGFGFSETAFRVFVLMASRRLKSDPFFSEFYDAATYSPEGLEWIDKTGMLDVLHRHHPELAPALGGVANAFAPWRGLA